MSTLLVRKSRRSGKNLYTVQVVIGNDRRCVPLGELTKASATLAKGHIESLAAARRAGVTFSGATADWLATIGDDLHARLAELGLVEPRTTVNDAPETESITLGGFVDQYIAGRSDVKPNTREHLKRAHTNLTSYFGENRLLASITPGDCDDFRRHLESMMAPNTARRICGRAKQFFRAAVRKRIIAENPCGDMIGLTVRANRSRDYFISRADANAVLTACPDSEWRAIFSLARFGGLRTPSETLELRWRDVDWKAKRLTIHSPKTAHHGDEHAERTVPLWIELETALKALWKDQLASGLDSKTNPLIEQLIIRRYRDRNCNLRTQLDRIIIKANLTPWPKRFQNLRATRATELARIEPGHVAASYLGHSNQIADDHYRQLTDEDYDRSLRAANALQHSVELGGLTKQPATTNAKNPDDKANRRDSGWKKAPPRGAEHSSESSGKSGVASSGAAESAAFPADPRLAALVTAWPTLSESARRVIEEIIGMAKE